MKHSSLLLLGQHLVLESLEETEKFSLIKGPDHPGPGSGKFWKLSGLVEF